MVLPVYPHSLYHILVHLLLVSHLFSSYFHLNQSFPAMLLLPQRCASAHLIQLLWK